MPEDSPDVLYQSIAEMLEKGDAEGLQSVLNSPSNSVELDLNLTEIVHCLCSEMVRLFKYGKSGVLDVILEFIQHLPLRIDTSECLLVLTAQLSLLKRDYACGHLLKPLALCIVDAGFERFARIKHSLEEITTLLAALCEQGSDRTTCKHLFWILNEVVDFYQTILVDYHFDGNNFERDNFLKSSLLFLFARPFLLLPSSAKVVALLNNALSMLTKAEPCLFTYFQHSFDQEISVPVLPFSLSIPAWLRLLSFIYFELQSTHSQYCWPLVFTKDYLLTLCDPIFRNVLDASRRQNLTEGTSALQYNSSAFLPVSAAFYDLIQQRCLVFLDNIIQHLALPLTSSWWTKDRIDFIDLLEAVATQPISSDVLPETTTHSIQLVDKLIKQSTCTAQYKLFRHLFDQKPTNIHYGWRGHIITVCKDAMHENLMECLHRGASSQMSKESLHEEQPQLLLDPPMFSRLCELIFVDPSTFSDPLIDQSSWILAALNMAIYLLLRSTAKPIEDQALFDVTFLSKCLTNPIESKFDFDVTFLQPLEKKLDTDLRICEGKIYSLEASLRTCDRNEKSRIQSAIPVQSATLLRLRLMDTTIKRLRCIMKEANVHT